MMHDCCDPEALREKVLKRTTRPPLDTRMGEVGARSQERDPTNKTQLFMCYLLKKEEGNPAVEIETLHNTSILLKGPAAD